MPRRVAPIANILIKNLLLNDLVHYFLGLYYWQGERKTRLLPFIELNVEKWGGGDKTGDGVFHVDESCGGNKTRKRHGGGGEKLQLLLWRSGKLQHILKDISPVS